LLNVDDMRHLGCYVPRSQCGQDLDKLYAHGEGENGDYFQPAARRKCQGIPGGLNRLGAVGPAEDSGATSRQGKSSNNVMESLEPTAGHSEM